MCVIFSQDAHRAYANQGPGELKAKNYMSRVIRKEDTGGVKRPTKSENTLHSTRFYMQPKYPVERSGKPPLEKENADKLD